MARFPKLAVGALLLSCNTGAGQVYWWRRRPAAAVRTFHTFTSAFQNNLKLLQSWTSRPLHAPEGAELWSFGMRTRSPCENSEEGFHSFKFWRWCITVWDFHVVVVPVLFFFNDLGDKVKKDFPDTFIEQIPVCSTSKYGIIIMIIVICSSRSRSSSCSIICIIMIVIVQTGSLCQN